MADVVFEYKPMPFVGLVACREAVLKPILKGLKTQALKLPLNRQHEQLQQVWRDRTTELSRAGWSRAEYGNGYQYLRNCPPFGVHYGLADTMKHQARRCRCRRICPNCYARETVLEVYRAIEWAYYLKSPRKLLDCDLVAIRKTWKFGTDLGTIFEAVTRDRNNYRDKFPDRVGSVVVSTVSPHKDGWQVSLSSIIAVKPGYKQSVGEAKVKRLASDKITKRKMAMLVGWALTYPLGLMYGPRTKVADLMAAFQARSSPRQTVVSGAMRNAAHRKLPYC